MRDDKNVAVLMTRKDRVELSVDPRLERHGALATSYDVPARRRRPSGPSVGETLRELLGGQAFPFAQVDLAQTRARDRRQTGRLADEPGRLVRTLEIAGVEAGIPVIGQPAADSPRLAAAFLRQRRVELALDAVFAVPGRLAVTDQQQSRGRRFG